MARLLYELGQDGFENYASYGCHVVAIFLLQTIYELISLIVFLTTLRLTGKWSDEVDFLVWPTIFAVFCLITWWLGPMAIFRENHLLLSICSLRAFVFTIFSILSTFIHLIVLEGYAAHAIGWMFMVPGGLYMIGSYYSARSASYFVTRYIGYDSADPDLIVVLGKAEKPKKAVFTRICDFAYDK